MQLICLLLLPLVLTSAQDVARCVHNANLQIYKEPFTRHGITYDKNYVNKSAPASVTFSIAQTGWKIESISWKHNDAEVNVDDNSRADIYYQTEVNGGEFHIVLFFKAPFARVTGTWTMTVQSSDSNVFVAQCRVSSPPVLKPRLTAARASGGYPLSIECEMESLPLPDRITWERVSEDGKTRTALTNVTYEEVNGVQKARVIWASADPSLNGFYFCHVEASAGSDSLLIQVRVKDKWALLWPCVGIAVELLVLLVTIVVYEKAQAKRRKATEDQENLLKASTPAASKSDAS